MSLFRRSREKATNPGGLVVTLRDTPPPPPPRPGRARLAVSVLPEAYHAAPHCSFHERTAVPDGYTYEHLAINTSPGATNLTLPQPPSVGDLVNLPGIATTFRVVERAWHYNAYGSANWPLGEHAPVTGPRLDVIVERDAGPFRDEVARDDEDG